MSEAAALGAGRLVTRMVAAGSSLKTLAGGTGSHLVVLLMVTNLNKPSSIPVSTAHSLLAGTDSCSTPMSNDAGSGRAVRPLILIAQLAADSSSCDTDYPQE
jgi:hypothetical protein